MPLIAAALTALIALPAFSSEQFGGMRGATLVVADSDTADETPLMMVPTNGFGRVIAQDRRRNRLFIETFDSRLAPSFWRLWVAYPGSGVLAPTAYRATAKHEYFYDEDSDTLFVFGDFAGEQRISKVDLETGGLTTVMVFPASIVWSDSRWAAAYDQQLNRLYVTGILNFGPGVSSEYALYAADLDSRTLITSPYRTRQAVRFVPHSSAGVLYAHTAQGVSSEIQQIIQIEFLTGSVRVVVAALPLELMTPIVYNSERSLLYLRRFRDGQVFLVDLVDGTYRTTAFRSDYHIEFAPFPFVALISVPLLTTPGTLGFVMLLAVGAWVLLRHP